MSTAANAGAAGPVTSPGKTLPPHLQKALGRVTEISSLPEITTRILQVVEDPQATAQDMHAIVKNDPALAAKILKVVNSAFYGLPSQIGSLDRAIIMIGLSAVKNIALAASLARFFKPDAVSDHFVASDLWRHCIGVGVCARLLAMRAQSPDADEYFVAGLVHDLGLLVAGQLFPEKFRAVVEFAHGNPQPFCAVEQELIGADHQTFGVALATKWKFPAGLRFAIGYHHDPSPLQPEFQRIATMIYIADTICCKFQHGFYLTARTQEVTVDLPVLVGLEAGAIEAVCEELPERIEEAEHVLGDI